MNKVFTGIPAYGIGLHPDIIGAFVAASERGHVEKFSTQQFSLITRNFNALLAQALNERKNGITHFLLWHSDIVPTTIFFVDKMLDLMEKKEADVLSAIIPIKDGTGRTSTAMEDPDDKWKFKRLTLKEVYDKRCNATFTDPLLVVNSGLMMIDIRKDWVQKVWFELEDEIFKNEDGLFQPRGVSEDWLYSRKAKAHGAKLYATREIKCHHVGTVKFPNDGPQGSMMHDE